MGLGFIGPGIKFGLVTLLSGYYNNQYFTFDASNPGIEELVDSKTIQYYDCVRIDIDPGHLYMYTQAPFGLTLAGPGATTPSEYYQPAGGLLQMTDFVDNANFSVEQLEIQLAGIVDMQGNQSVLKTIQTLDYIDKPVTIYRVFFWKNKPSAQIVLYQGYINNISAALGSEGDSTTASISTASHWTDFDRTSTRYTNQNSQHDLYPADNGFSFAKEVQKEVQWKEA